MNDLLDLAVLIGGALTLVRVVLVVIGAKLILRFTDAFVDKVLQGPVKSEKRFSEERAKTLSGIMKSGARYTLTILAFLMILDLFGIDTKALLGGVAILGLAVGFGAQSLVKDVITGFFLIYEKQYDVGDYIIAAGVQGVVTELGLRTTSLRDWSGEVHVVPNGLIEKTTNRSKAESRALVTVTVPYETDVRSMIDILQASIEGMAGEFAAIEAGPRVLGISEFTERGINLMAWARTKPLEQWGVEREMRIRMREALVKAGIPHSYPRMVVKNDEKSDEHV